MSPWRWRIVALLLFLYAVVMTYIAARRGFVVRLPTTKDWAAVYVSLFAAVVALVSVLTTAGVTVWMQKRSDRIRREERDYNEALAIRASSEKVLAPVMQFLSRADPIHYWHPWPFSDDDDTDLLFEENEDQLSGLNGGWIQCEPSVLGLVVTWADTDIATKAKRLAEVSTELLVTLSHMIHQRVQSDWEEAEAKAKRLREEAISLVEALSAEMRQRRTERQELAR